MRRRMRAGIAATIALATALIPATVLGPAMPAAADPVRDAEYWLAEYGITTAWQTTQGATGWPPA